MKLYNILMKVWCPTSKTKLDIKYNKLGTQDDSWVAKRLKTWDLGKLGNIKKSHIKVET